MAEPKARKTAAKAQHPATAGEPEMEVDQRSADGSDGMRHVKEFVVLGGGLRDEDGPEHIANKANVVQSAIQHGLHPRGDVRLDGVAKHPDGMSRVFTYSVEVVPASVDDHAEDTTTPRKVDEGGA